jgi:hypothetical protein
MMAIIKRPGTIMLAGFISAALVAAVSVAPASAASAPTWTIKPGGTITAKAASASLEDTSNSESLSCTGSAITATLKSGKKLSGTDAGSVSAFSLTKCGADGFFLSISPKHLPWDLSLVSYDAATGDTTVVMTGIHLLLSLKALGCSGEVDGTSATAHDGKVKLTYSNKTGQLTTWKTEGNLHLYDVTSGCLGVIKTGDKAAITATYTVTPAQTITSP